MNSYEKKKRTIEIYELMKDNIESIARDMIDDPTGFIPSEYANVPKVTEDMQKIVKEAARLFLDEIKTRMLEIYKL